MPFQTILWKDYLHEMEIKLTNSTIFTFEINPFRSLGDAIHHIDDIAAVSHVHFTGPVDSRSLTVTLVDGRTSVWQFFDSQMEKYTLHIDSAPWTEEEIQPLIPLRQALRAIQQGVEGVESIEWRKV
jgi:hypothetical protein